MNWNNGGRGVMSCHGVVETPWSPRNAYLDSRVPTRSTLSIVPIADRAGVFAKRLIATPCWISKTFLSPAIGLLALPCNARTRSSENEAWRFQRIPLRVGVSRKPSLVINPKIPYPLAVDTASEHENNLTESSCR